MRILHVIDSLGASGAEHSTAMTMVELARRGHHVGAATLYDAGYGDEQRWRASGLDIRPLTSRRFVARVRELRRRIVAERPDVVHTTLFNADVIGRLAAWRTSAVVVSSLVNTTYDPVRLKDPNVDRRRLRAVRAIDGFTARHLVTRFHAVSAGAADANVRDLRLRPDRVEVVHRGRSREQLGTWSQHRRVTVRAALGVATDDRVVLTAGRQEFQKAHDVLVAATGALLTLQPGVIGRLRVWIAGRDGSASTALRAALDAHPHAAEHITLLGHRSDVADLICAADVLAIPSRYEGTAGVAIEAMALQCPVVCTDLEGVRGVLDGGRNALLVPVGDSAAMADALGRVLHEPELADRLRAEGAADFEGRFTIDRAATGMERLYETAVAAGPARLGRSRHRRRPTAEAT